LKSLNGEETDIDLILWNPNTRKSVLKRKPNKDNIVVAAVVTIKDISKYKAMEEELKETESKYRELIGFRKEKKKDDEKKK
jgi:hypothetical protein